MEPALRLIDLFSGAGGMTKGFTNTNSYTLEQAVEMDVSAAATYSENFGDSHLFVGGISEWLETMPTPVADVVIGGPPCQGFSALGKQDVLDVRNVLWQEYARTIARAQPNYFVMENVAKFLDSSQFVQLCAATEPGELLGSYALQSFVLNAADYGSFQARKRAVVIGRRRHLPPIEMPTGRHLKQHRTVREAFERLPLKADGVELSDRRLDFMGASLRGAYRSDELHLGRNYTELSLSRFSHIPVGGNRFNLPRDLQARCWRDHTSGSGDVMGRLHWDRPSVTIRTEFFKPEKGRYLHPTEHRAITHFEAAVLQGFPHDYKWVGTKVSIARQIGNAVPVQLAEFLGELVAGLPR